MNITCKFETIRRISHTISLSGAVGIRMTHMAQEWTDFSPCGVWATPLSSRGVYHTVVCEIIVKSLKKVGWPIF